MTSAPEPWDLLAAFALMRGCQVEIERKKLDPGHPALDRPSRRVVAGLVSEDLAAVRAGCQELLAAAAGLPVGDHDWTLPGPVHRPPDEYPVRATRARHRAGELPGRTPARGK
ncbi:MAG: hypothetical protein K2X87_05280 [Gemmataceae bacterium]|nr:hypothetical protein [Gemmataceae bacterium]